MPVLLRQDENTVLKDQVKELQAKLEAQVRGAAAEVLPTSSRSSQQFWQRRTAGGSTGFPAKPVRNLPSFRIPTASLMSNMWLC